MKNKKILKEEINRILKIMNVENRFQVLLETRITKQQVDKLSDFFRNNIVNQQPNARTRNVDITTKGLDGTPKTYSFPQTDFNVFTQKIDDLQRSADFDYFLSRLNSREYNVVTDMIISKDDLLNKIYNDYMTNLFNEINLSGGRIIKTEAQFIEELNSVLKNDKDLTLKELLAQFNIPSFYSDIFSHKINQKLEYLNDADMNKFAQSTKEIVTDVFLKENNQGALNPINWTRNMENEVSLDNDELEELIKIVEPDWWKKVLPLYVKNQKDAESIALLLSRLNRATQNITPEQIKLNEKILEAIDQRLKYMYSTNREIYKEVSFYLNRNAAKVDPDSNLGKVLDKIKKYPDDAMKTYSISLAHKPARNALESMRNAINAVDWTEVVKSPIRFVTQPMKLKQSWRDKRNKWMETWLGGETRNWDEFKKLMRTGSSKDSEYFNKILQDGKKLNYFIERFGESFLRVMRFKLQLAFLETILEGSLQFMYYPFRDEKIESCRTDLLKTISADKRHKDKSGKYVPASPDDLGYYAEAAAPEYDLFAILQEGIDLPPTCANLNILDKAVIDYMSQGETAYFLTELIENSKKQVVGGLTKDFGSTLLSTAIPGYIDDIAIYAIKAINANREGGPQKIMKGFRDSVDEVKREGHAALDSLENNPRFIDAQRRIDSLDQVIRNQQLPGLIKGDEEGLKKYLEKLTEPKDYESGTFQPETGSGTGTEPAEGQDTEGTVYIYVNNKWGEKI